MHIANRELRYRDPDGAIQVARPGDQIHGFLTWPQVNRDAVLRRGTVSEISAGEEEQLPVGHMAPVRVADDAVKMEHTEATSEWAEAAQAAQAAQQTERVIRADSNMLPIRRVEYGSVDAPLPDVVEVPAFIAPAVPVSDSDIEQVSALAEAAPAVFVCGDCDGRVFKTKGALGIHRAKAHR